MLGFWSDQELVAAIDAARGSIPRSQFLRDALLAYCKKHGFEVPASAASAPDRARRHRSAVEEPANGIRIDEVARKAVIRALRVEGLPAPPLKTIAASPTGTAAAPAAPAQPAPSAQPSPPARVRGRRA